jgi:hypothetical protein
MTQPSQRRHDDDDDDDDELQSEKEAQHASTRIQHRGSHGTHPEMATLR